MSSVDDGEQPDQPEAPVDDCGHLKTVGEIVAELRRRDKRLKHMPSAVARRQETKKRRIDRLSDPANPTTATDQPVSKGLSADCILPVPAEPVEPAPTPAEDNIAPDQGGVVAPRVRIDENGNIVLDEKSLVVTAGETLDTGPRNTTTVEFGTKHVTSFSFSNRERSLKWSKDDTDTFYEGLRKFGTDFMMISCLFDGVRTRRQIKLKFKREEKRVPSQVEAALLNREKLTEDDMRLIEQAGKSTNNPTQPDSPTTVGTPGEGDQVLSEGEKVVSGAQASAKYTREALDRIPI